jgi:hypothetical protein
MTIKDNNKSNNDVVQNIIKLHNNNKNNNIIYVNLNANNDICFNTSNITRDKEIKSFRFLPYPHIC